MLLGAGTRCPAHVDDPHPPPCGACKERREAYETAKRNQPSPRVGLTQEELRREAARREREASRNPREHIARIKADLLARSSRPSA